MHPTTTSTQSETGNYIGLLNHQHESELSKKMLNSSPTSPPLSPYGLGSSQGFENVFASERTIPYHNFSKEENRLPPVHNLYGVPTPRFCAFMSNGMHELYVPIGPNICGWNLLGDKEGKNVSSSNEQVFDSNDVVSKRFLNFPAHSNVITYLEQNPKYPHIVASACYSAEVKLWKFDNTVDVHSSGENPFECIFQIDRIPHAYRCQCGVWSKDGTKLLVCSEGNGGRLSFYNFDPESCVLTLIDQAVGYFQMASFIQIEGDTEDRIHVLAVEQIKQKKECGVSLALFEIREGKVVQFVDSLILNRNGPLCTTIQRNENQLKLAVAFQDRCVRVFELSAKAEIIETTSFTALGRGSIFMMQFNDNEELFFHNCEKKTIDKYQINKSESPVPGDTLLMAQYSLSSSALALYFFKWLRDDVIWTYIDSEFSLVKIDYSSPSTKKGNTDAINITPSTRLNSTRYHDLTCCGIDFSPDGEYLITGDFVGQVMLWKAGSYGLGHDPVMTCFVPGSIRAICCKWHENCWEDFEIDQNMNRKILSIFIGSLDKNVHCWNIDLDNMTTIDDPCSNIKFSLTSDIVCLRWCNGPSPRLLACGSSNGMLCVMEDNSRESPILKIKLAIIAHKPIFDNKDPRFGSISKFSEIWSICFSPCNKYVVTCSEDQTTRIFDLYGTQIHSLTGHTTAVTSVEWKYIKGIGEVITTCADDRSVMIWRLNTQYTDKDKHYHHYHQLYELEKQQGKAAEEVDFDIQERHSMDRWGLYHVFRTDQYGLDWHTLTYLQIEPRGTRIGVSTQNGFVFVWDMKSKTLQSFGKGHQGSIEGLKWVTCEEKNLLATCSSDCTINVYNMGS